MTTVVVDGPDGPTTVTEGDYVCFKCDIEQSGQIVKIKNGTLVLTTGDNGFHGDYIGGNHYHEIATSDCWTE